MRSNSGCWVVAASLCEACSEDRQISGIASLIRFRQGYSVTGRATLQIWPRFVPVGALFVGVRDLQNARFIQGFA
jgi:hypothetical protein